MQNYLSMFNVIDNDNIHDILLYTHLDVTIISIECSTQKNDVKIYKIGKWSVVKERKLFYWYVRKEKSLSKAKKYKFIL